MDKMLFWNKLTGVKKKRMIKYIPNNFSLKEYISEAVSLVCIQRCKEVKEKLPFKNKNNAIVFKSTGLDAELIWYNKVHLL